MVRDPLFLLIICCVIGWQTVSAQYRFDSWTTDNGLPQNGVRYIVQTPDGYLWFTTFDGLVRFDGVKFTVFDKGNTKGIINNRFSVLYSTPDGTLWAATEDGILTIYRNGTFSSIDVKQILGVNIYGFDSDANGETRLRTNNDYYYFRDNQLVFAEAIKVEDTQKKIIVMPSGTKWTITANETRELKNGRETIYPIKVKDMTKVDRRFSFGIYEDRHGGLWLSELGGIHHLHSGNIAYYAQKEGIPPYTFPHQFWEEADGSLWFGTGDQNMAGVGLFQFKDGKFNRFGMEAGLSNDRVMSVFKDREGTLWIATNKGLNRLRRQIITTLSTKDGLVHNEVYPILQGKNNEILIGTAQGLSRYKDGKFRNEALIEGFLGACCANLQALFEDKKGRLWTGVVGGLDFYENGKKTNFNIEGTATSIISDRNDNIWIGSWSGGLFKINNDKITARYTTNEGLPNNDVKVIHEDREGNLWVGTYGGIAVLSPDFSRQSPEEIRLKAGLKTYTTKEGLASDRVRSIYEDADGVLWIGTYDGGLSRFKDGKFFNFTVDNGLFNNGVFATLEDNYGNFWISCNKGIFRVNKQQLNDFADGKILRYDSFSYGKEDGMINTECNGGRQPSAMKDKDGKLWFPTLEGVAIVDPDLITTNSLPPHVEIETVAIDRDPLTTEDLLPKIKNPESKVEIGSSQTSLDITYTGLSFIKSDQIHFRYKLEGLDKDWINAGTRRTVNYSYLPPGEYTFTVMAANSDGIWNTQGKSIKIVVIAPVYRTWWFWMFLAFCIAGIAFFIYRYRVAQLKKVHEAHEAFSKKLIESQEAFSQQLIESQEQERKRIAGELHDSLGQNLIIIKNRALLGLAIEDKDKAKNQFDEIQESVTEALNEVRTIAYNLRPLHLDRLGLTSTIEEMVEEVEAASGIKINCDIEPIDNLFTKENEINFYRIVQESLNNIVKHSRAKKASVSIYTENQNVFLIVKDNGRGIKSDSLNGHRGFGLNGIAERVKILGGTHSIESAKGKGTTVSVTIDRETGRQGEGD